MTTAIQTIEAALLVTATGGQSTVNMPLSGRVDQQVNTNWGLGNQTNIGTQVINQAPKAPTTILEAMRTIPGFRWTYRPNVPRPINRPMIRVR